MENIVNDEDCQLSEIESKLVCSILGDLERQMDLVRFATLKSETVELQKLPPIKAVNNAFKKLNLDCEPEASSFSECNVRDNSDHPDEAALEAKLVYSNLVEEFSKFKTGMGESQAEDDSRKSESLQDFSRNVDCILNVIKKTKLSLQETNNFGVLKTEVDRMSKELNQEAQLQSNIEDAKKRISKLKQDIAELEVSSFSEEQLKVGEINRLKDKHFLIESERQETLHFAKMYFEARSTVSKCTHRDDTSAQKKLISEANAKIDRDVHCLATMEAWTQNFCEKLEEEIDSWKLKLRKDEMLMDMRIDSKRRDIEAQEELMKSLNETIAQRLEELAPWEEEKALEKQERLAHMRRYYSARKLQRWWRGYMVKLKLYRRRKLKTKG